MSNDCQSVVPRLGRLPLGPLCVSLSRAESSKQALIVSKVPPFLVLFVTGYVALIFAIHVENKLLSKTSHRPWPLPSRPWAMAMRWHDLLFLHWPVRPGMIQPLIPRGLELDTFNGDAWIGIIPFRMTGVRPRYLPRFAGMAFPEINVRTYVWTPGRSGVWFFSLDAANRLAVRTARSRYGLPYYDARINVRSRRGTVQYQSVRIDKKSAGAEFHASYKPAGDIYRSAPETLDRWLTDRYCLYAVDRHGRLSCADIHHAPWPLQPAEVELRVNTMTKTLGIELPQSAPVAYFARHLEVLAWQAVPVES
jgi:uncharacterized protein